MKVHVKKINLIPAIKLLAEREVMYHIEEGMCFGKDVYWIELSSDKEDEVINCIRLIGHLAEDSDDVYGVHIDQVAHGAIESILEWRENWKKGNRDDEDDFPLMLENEESWEFYNSINEAISSKIFE